MSSRPCSTLGAAALVSLALAVTAASQEAPRSECSSGSGETPPAFDAHSTRLGPDEAQFLQRLFALTRAASSDNAELMRWLVSGRREGLHPGDHRQRIERHVAALDVAPDRLAPIRALVLGAIAAQRVFFADWERALVEGRDFDSQLTSEFGWNDDLDRSRRMLLRAYAKLLGVDPAENDANRRAFHEELCKLARIGGDRR